MSDTNRNQDIGQQSTNQNVGNVSKPHLSRDMSDDDYGLLDDEGRKQYEQQFGKRDSIGTTDNNRRV